MNIELSEFHVMKQYRLVSLSLQVFCFGLSMLGNSSALRPNLWTMFRKPQNGGNFFGVVPQAQPNEHDLWKIIFYCCDMNSNEASQLFASESHCLSPFPVWFVYFKNFGCKMNYVRLR